MIVMALAVHSSSPARVTGTTQPVTTATFNPPACVLIVTVSHDGASAPTITVTNNGTALTWNPIAVRNSADSGGLSGAVAAYFAVLTAARTGMTVTASSSLSNDITLKVYGVTGANATDTIGAVAEGSSTTNNLTTTAITTEAADSLGFVVINDYNALGVPTSTDATLDTYHVSGQISGASGYKPLGAASASATFNIDAGGTGNPESNWIAFEVLAASLPPSPTSSTLHRLVEVGGLYPERPETGYVDFLGSVDPESLMEIGDTWTQTESEPG